MAQSQVFNTNSLLWLLNVSLLRGDPETLIESVTRVLSTDMWCRPLQLVSGRTRTNTKFPST